MDATRRLERLIESQYARGNCGSIVLAVCSDDGRVEWSGGDGPSSTTDPSPMHAASPFFIASATKLYTTAILLQLIDEGVLRFEDRAVDLLPDVNLAGIHVLDRVDRSAQITLRHLIAHTSGLADYFEQKQRNGASIMDGLVAGIDRSWTLEDVLELNRAQLSPHFVPGAPKRALYSDTNYQLLGAVIERLTGLAFAEAVAVRIARPLGLSSTYVYSDNDLARYDSIAAMKHGKHTLRIPRAMASFGPDGGIVSTAQECMGFLEAFVRGRLFQRHHLDEIQVWNRIFFPLQYGVGIMKFQLPWFFSPFKPFPAFIGHSGASGAIMYYCPARGVFVCGTVNQTKQRDLPYRLMLQALSALR